VEAKDRIFNYLPFGRACGKPEYRGLGGGSRISTRPGGTFLVVGHRNSNVHH
jgi:hypothetical protein